MVASHSAHSAKSDARLCRVCGAQAVSGGEVKRGALPGAEIALNRRRITLPSTCRPLHGGSWWMQYCRQQRSLATSSWHWPHSLVFFPHQTATKTAAGADMSGLVVADRRSLHFRPTTSFTHLCVEQQRTRGEGGINGEDNTGEYGGST